MMKRGVDGMIGESYQMEGVAWARELRKVLVLYIYMNIYIHIYMYTYMSVHIKI